jgi:hypothetical protein
MKKLSIILIIVILSGLLFAGKRTEKDYQKEFAKQVKGKMEVKTSDNTRCDVVTDTHAIEMDWADKWYQGVGQSLYYALMLKKKPGVVLIVKTESDKKYLHRLKMVADKYNIRTWIINSKFEILKPLRIKLPRPTLY